MNPLTVTWAQTFTQNGVGGISNVIHAGHDNLHTPNGKVHRLLTRLSTEILFHPFQAFMFGQKNLAPVMADRFDIPLVFFGENEAEYGNPIADTESAERDWRYFSAQEDSEIFLGGVSVADLIDRFGLSKVDLKPYLPIDPDRLKQKTSKFTISVII